MTHEHLRLRRRREASQVHDRVELVHCTHGGKFFCMIDTPASRFHRPGDRSDARLRYGCVVINAASGIEVNTRRVFWKPRSRAGSHHRHQRLDGRTSTSQLIDKFKSCSASRACFSMFRWAKGGFAAWPARSSARRRPGAGTTEDISEPLLERSSSPTKT